ncbi:MAG: cyclase family protein [Bacteroidia bacterium]
MFNKIIDLSHILNEHITVYPDTVGPKFEILNTVEEHGYAELKMDMVLHSGTHIDAPCHILKGTKSLDQFPVDTFAGSAIVIPCFDKKEISLEYLHLYEDKISRVDFILFYTGWQHKWNTESYFEDCPTLTSEAATWLTKFNLKGIGFDSFSVDKVVSAQKVTPETLPNHYILLGKEIILVENLTNLNKLPNDIFMFQCLPLNIENANGSPVRAIAMIN